jgi:hypothetical protein
MDAGGDNEGIKMTKLTDISYNNFEIDRRGDF